MKWRSIGTVWTYLHEKDGACGSRVDGLPPPLSLLLYYLLLMMYIAHKFLLLHRIVDLDLLLFKFFGLCVTL